MNNQVHVDAMNQQQRQSLSTMMLDQSTDRTIYNDGVLELRVMSPRDRFAAACRHDGIDPSSMFAVFSEGNPYV